VIRILPHLLCAALFALLVPGAAAHVAATGLAIVTVDGSTVTYRLNVVPAELPEPAAQLLIQAMGGNRVQAERLAEAARRAVTLRVDGRSCRPGRIAVQGGGGKAILNLTLHCPAAPGRLELEEDWGELFGPHYLTIASIAGGEHLLGGNRRVASAEFGVPATSGFLGFVRLGVMHILTGYDHLLFLLALLIGAIRPCPALAAHAIERSTGVFWRVLAIASAFTVAHSITLSFAVLDQVRVPSGIIEPLIAASIVFVGVENLIGTGPPWRRLAVAFVFGLVHGLGFADALQPLGLAGWPFSRALIGFNLGVELGQAAAIAVALPVMLAIGRAGRAMPVDRYASLAVATVGAWWLVERIVSD